MVSQRGAWETSLGEFDNIVALLESRASRRGDDRFVTFPDKPLSYADLFERANRVATGLSSLGIGDGDRVAVMMHNRSAFLEAYFGVLRTGAVFAPLNVALRGDDLTYALTDADPDVAIIGDDCLDTYREVESAVDIDHELLVGDASAEFEQFEDLLADGEPPEVNATRGDAATMIYTSGTTGMPKGVVLPHGALLAVGTEMAERTIKPGPEDCLYMSQPLFHVFAHMVIMEGLVAEVPVAMERRFSKSRFWDRVREHGATIIHFSTAISEILVRDTEAPDTPVRVAVGAIADERQAEFEEKFDCTVVPLYGLTESSGLALSGTVDDPRTGSIGQPVSYHQATVVDEDDEPVAPGEHGEIVLRPRRPYSMFSQYYGKPEATLETLENGWLHTGDIGYVDEAGDFHFVERQAYFIRRMGENVSAFEVERIIEDHPAVDRVAVVGADAEVAGQEVFAAVIPEAGADLEPLDVVEHCEGRLAYFKIPRYVAIVDAFPTTETKETVQRFKIVDRHMADAWDREAAGYELER